MTIEDRVRRVLAEAAADEPPLRGAPLEAALRRRRRRPVLVGAVAVVLVLAAVAGLAAVRARQRPLPSVDPTRDWTTWTDSSGNLRLRYPPGWVLREKGPGWVRIAPPDQAAGVLRDQPPFAVGVRAPAPGYYLGEQSGVNLTRGRLAGGQAYVVVEGIADPGPPPRGTATTRDPAGLARYRTYTIDWGRPCTGGGARCGTRVVMAGVMAANRALWDRYRAVGETIVGAIAPVTALAPSSGDRSRPACRPDQWRLFHPGGWSYGDLAQRYVLEGGVAFRGGPPCHLRLALRLEVLRPDGRRLPLPGNPSTTTVEGDLPEDRQLGGGAVTPTPLGWYWGWQEWCNRDMPQGRMRVSAETGATITVPGPPAPGTPGEPDTGCRDRGRPSTVAPFP